MKGFRVKGFGGRGGFTGLGLRVVGFRGLGASGLGIPLGAHSESLRVPTLASRVHKQSLGLRALDLGACVLMC